MLHYILYFGFVQVSLLVPGYVLIKRIGILAKYPGIELSFAYLITIALYAFLATIDYAFKFSPLVSRLICWLAILGGLYLIVYYKYWKDLLALRFPLMCLILMSVFSLVFIGLSLQSKLTYIPDPQYTQSRNYQVPNVKVLNLARTQANDNYVPYRQAQFFINRSDPSKDSFISEWGVSFFQRTPLMGAVTSNYFNLLNDKPPIDYLWSSTAADPSHTYPKFQIIAQVLNSLFIVPAFFLLRKLFNKKTAIITSLFLILSPFFLYNSFFSWPKSFVAFFVLTAWLLLLEKKKHYIYLATAAGALAYLAHDLAVIYIGATVVLLLLNKRFRDAAIFTTAPIAFIALWVGVASLIFHHPSTFIYYPFSTQGIPANGHGIFHQFLHTPITRLVAIRGDSLYFLASPYQLIYSAHQDLARRIWATGIFTIPGAVGAGLVIPVLLAMFKKMFTKYLVVTTLVPLLLCAVIIGWPQGLGALHFAEVIVVMLSGVGVFFLTKLKNMLWLALAYVAHCAQLIFFIGYSYSFHIGVWFSHFSDIVRLLVMVSIIGLASLLVYLAARDKDSVLLPA